MNPFNSIWDIIKYLEQATEDKEPLNKRELENIKEVLNSVQSENYKASSLCMDMEKMVKAYKEYR